MTARTKRNARKTRKATTAAGRLNQIRTEALGAVENLMKQGEALRNRGHKLATAKARQARAAVRGAREAVTARAGEARTRTLQTVTQLEKAFENRVQGAIAKLGVPTARDVRALSRQVAQLQQSVDQLRRVRARS